MLNNEWRPLAPQVKKLWLISAGIGAAFWTIAPLLAELLGFRRIPGWPTGLLTVVMALLFGVLPLVMASLKHKHWRWRLGEDDLAVKSGVIWRMERIIARARIQHVDITSGVFSRMLGVVDVSVYVGGKLTAAISIPGILPDEAEELRRVLLAAMEEEPPAAPPPPPPLPQTGPEPPPAL